MHIICKDITMLFFFKKQNNISPQVRVVRIGEEGEKILGEEGTKKRTGFSKSEDSDLRCI